DRVSYTSAQIICAHACSSLEASMARRHARVTRHALPSVQSVCLTATGTQMFQIFGALAEFERNLIKERTVAGLNAARARGRTGGRPKRNPQSGKIALAKKFYNDNSLSIAEILKTLNISKSTLYRWVDIDKGNRKKAC